MCVNCKAFKEKITLPSFWFSIIALSITTTAPWGNPSIGNANMMLQSSLSTEQLAARLVAKEWDHIFNRNHPNVINSTSYIEQVIRSKEHLDNSTITKIKETSHKLRLHAIFMDKLPFFLESAWERWTDENDTFNEHDLGELLDAFNTHSIGTQELPVSLTGAQEHLSNKLRTLIMVSRGLMQFICPTLSPSPAPTSDICSLSPDSGPCRAAIRRFYWDESRGKCRKFVYGGCGGNANNFIRRRQCNRACHS